ncbi:hypothetical protein [Kurthia senegalensis]|uniref:hypothetical protein n=1 Tax=Kurthia senegalensis TaxID=1033740 RepID=UPI000289C8F2|nr:hypothetical protein [Kurthia senegalensis]
MKWMISICLALLVAGCSNAFSLAISLNMPKPTVDANGNVSITMDVVTEKGEAVPEEELKTVSFEVFLNDDEEAIQRLAAVRQEDGTYNASVTLSKGTYTVTGHVETITGHAAMNQEITVK